ncbi:Signal peptide peptidase-like 2 [Vitis vinifera]|uniref:Signal peptide peptidase-like 2 n=1 Tax=Vitis vinifera TaxID=29760 RepID=A0A438CCC5_VITVI|nr:Signal peptide peptidase-like 2 [Vitis vinifera]
MVRSLSLFNKALLCKWCWHFASEGDSYGRKSLSVSLGEGRGVEVKSGERFMWSWGWKEIEKHWELFNSMISFEVGNGRRVSFGKIGGVELGAMERFLSLLQGHSMKREQEDTVVKVKNWVDGKEHESLVGLTARFGASLPTESHDHLRLPAVFSNPMNCCSDSSSEELLILFDVDRKPFRALLLCPHVGIVPSWLRQKVAQSGDAAALLVINDKEDIYKMVCSENDTIVNITIPVVMIPKSGGDTLSKSIADGKKGFLAFFSLPLGAFCILPRYGYPLLYNIVELLLYAPTRPVVDSAVVFLWMMAVGTVVCASLWSEYIACEQNDERYNELSPKAGATKDDPEKEVLDISAKGAVGFVITASTFLVLLYFFMSSWFVWVLIVLFCIGGVEGMHACIVTLILRGCKNSERKTVNLPLFGEVTVLSLGVLLFCLSFAIAWAITRKASFSWIGQDVLVSSSC